MRRDIKKGMKKAAIGIVAATMLTVMAAPVSVLPVSAATVTRGSYDFSNMVVRRVWFNTNDPVFLIDDYERVWLDNNVNVVVLFQPFFSSIASIHPFLSALRGSSASRRPSPISVREIMVITMARPGKMVR